jgi:hypothetical protein
MSRKPKITQSEQQKEDWMNSKWRPMMGWMYMVVCSFDFVIAPILWSLLQSISQGSVQTQWQPLTLQGAGLFHIAMGAVLGIAAYGRTQEKLGGANNGGIQLPPTVGTTYIPPSSNTNTNINLGNQAPVQNSGFGGYSNGGFITPTGGPTAFGAPAAGGFGTSSPNFGPAPITTGYGGKKAPPQPDFPEI